MDQQRRTLRVGAAVIVCAVALPLAGSGFFQPVVQALGQPEVASFLVYLETGRVVRPSAALSAAPTDETVPTTAGATVPPEAAVEKPIFTTDDTSLVGITYNCSYRPDIGTLLTQALTWDLTGDEPTVLILHTHATESYTQGDGENYEASSAYRTLDEGYNMLAIGDRVAELLESGGITVLHDRTFHDYPSYSGSYAASRDTIAAYLAQYPSIQLILDLHRDAAEDSNGNQIATTAEINGRSSAQLMLVVGSDAGGLTHPNWQENLAIALKLQAQLERQYPGLCRNMNFCSQRYNQDMLPGALLVEVGAAGNTQAQALVAAEALAQSILSLENGTA